MRRRGRESPRGGRGVEEVEVNERGREARGDVLLIEIFS